MGRSGGSSNQVCHLDQLGIRLNLARVRLGKDCSKVERSSALSPVAILSLLSLSISHMSTDIPLRNLPSVYLPSHQEGLFVTNGPESESTPTEVYRAATPGTEAVQADVQLNARPPFVRLDSTQTVVVKTDDTGKGSESIKSRVAGSVPGDAGGGTPQPRDTTILRQDVFISEARPLDETKAMRRLRMASSFVTLFLAGWK